MENWTVNIGKREFWNGHLRFKTKEEAIEYMKKNFDGEYAEEMGEDFDPETMDRVFEVGYITLYEPYINADRVIEDVVEQAYDDVGEVSESYLEKVDSKELDLLSEKMNDVFKEWMKETKNEPEFYSVKRVEEVKV